MIYEVRSYHLQTPDTAEEFERLFADGYIHREQYSPLTGFWHTIDDSVDEVVHVWPYEDLGDREAKRADAAKHPSWPPATAHLVDRMCAEVVIPFDFVAVPDSGQVGPIFEIRYDYFKVSDLRAGAAASASAVQRRSETDALVLAGRLEFGQVNGVVHIWAYPDLDARARALDGQRRRSPQDGPAPIQQVSKLMLPAAYSPLQ